jgi:hypothetical protein
MKRRMRIVHQIHDAVYCEWKEAMKEPVYAMDDTDIVHLWYPDKTTGFAGCELRREDVAVFLVTSTATCLTCLAQQHGVEEDQDEVGSAYLQALMRRSLEPQLNAFMGYVGYSPHDALTTMQLMREFEAAEVPVTCYGVCKDKGV